MLRRLRGCIRREAFFLLVLLSLPFALLAFSAPRVYAPLGVGASPLPPQLVYTEASALGANATSAESDVALSQGSVELVKNPDFYSGPDNWYCMPGQNLSCYWNSTDTSGGASGGVAIIYGTLSAGEFDYAFLVQPVTMPSASITSLTMTVRARYASQPILANRIVYVMGLYDSDAQQYVAYREFTPTITYQTFTLSINPSSVTPGKQYLVVVGVEVNMSSLVLINTEEFIVDYVLLEAGINGATYSGVVAALNNTGGAPVYSRLFLYDYTANNTFNATIWLENNGGASSTPINITNGDVYAASTSWVEAPAGVSGYNSLYVEASISAPTNTTINMYLYLVTCSGGPARGACVVYPLVIRASG